MFDAVIDGLLLVVQWPAAGYLLLGVMLGMFFGAVPGLSGLVGMAILLPFTFGLDAGSAFAFLLGMYAVTTTADTLSSVLLGVPGTAASQATILDGYPMAQRGEASRALGAAYMVSMVGGVLGAVFLALSIPLVKPLILSFAEPEFFMLAVLGLTMVGSLSGGSIYKGLASACLGLLLSMIGYAEFGGIPRYTFGENYLLDGLPLVPVVLGLFALPEMIDLAVRGSSISRVADAGTGMLDGFKDAGRHWWLALRCTAIGVYVGMLPGLGGSLVDWVAYGHAVQSAKDKSQFGKGDIRGVIAPEAANNAMKGGALLPTIAFAIPGSAAMAILLSAFLIQGLEPGPRMLTDRLDISFSLVWTLVIANILGAGLLMVWGQQVAKVTFLPGHFLVPAIVLFVFMGAWIGNGVLGDWISLLLFGLIGWVMKLSGWSRPPLVLGYILGKIMENGLQIGVQTHGWNFLTGPVMLIIMGLIAITLVAAWRRHRKDRAAAIVAGPAKAVGDAVEVTNPGVALVFDVLLLAMFIAAAVMAVEWRPAARLFPLVSALPAILLLVIVVWCDARFLRERAAGPAEDAAGVALRRGSAFYLWMVAIVAATLVIGQYFALLAFVALYLRIWGRAGWALVAAYTFGSGVVLYLLFNLVVPVLWHESPFFSLFT
ncbi:MAG: tricarboxylate transporter [Alphaproteobacteria bacterium]|nr:tricarboxylate transporter [Alphaproteobacteria bacterium]